MNLIMNLLADMRDRHLVIPALALVVALIAVPTLLAQPAEDPLPAPAPAGDTQKDDLAATPAVLASQDIGVRQYRERLEVLQKKDPFKQQFITQPEQTDVSVSVDGGSAGALGGTDVTVNGNGPVIVDEGKGNSSDTEVVTKLVTLRVDVKIGVDGEAKVHNDVKPTTMLPSRVNPVVAYLGTDESGKFASFVLSRNSTAVGGEGSCVPAPNDCAYVTLTKGQAALIENSIDGKTYRLELLKIRPVKKG